MEANLDLAPDSKLSAERVSDPDAGMGESSEQAMFAIPTENMSWLTSGRSPVRLPRDFPMTVFSSDARKAMANATLMRVAMSLKLKSGSVGEKLSSWNDWKHAKSKCPVVFFNINVMIEEIARQSAKFGSIGSLLIRLR